MQGAPAAAPAGGPEADPTAASQAADKAGQLGKAGAAAGMKAGSAIAGKGMTMVKEMDAGQVGMLIKAVNLLTGAVVALYSGAFLAWKQIMYCNLWCDTAVPLADGGCCATASGFIPDPTNPPDDPSCAGQTIGFFSNFGTFIIAAYMIPFGGILFIYELTTKRSGAASGAVDGGDFGGSVGGKVANFREMLTRYFGFIFFYGKRMQFLLFVGILCLGNINNKEAESYAFRDWTQPVVGGVLCILNALFHFMVKRQHPEFDQGMSDNLNAAHAEEMSSDSASTYEIDTPSAPTYSARPAAPPAGNIYAASGGDDGGTAITQPLER